MLNLKILLVDDQPAFLDGLAVGLQHAGFDVTTQCDPTGALRLAGNGFDAITTDLAMPGMNGHEFIERVRAMRTTRIPMVVLSGEPLPGQAHEGKGWLSCQRLPKSCSADDVATVLELLVSSCSQDGKWCSTCPCDALAGYSARHR
jgi:CheY-like chemotaxis protein